MHHPTDMIAYTTAFVIPDVEQIALWVYREGWLERDRLSGSTRRDRSDDPPYHERTRYHAATSLSDRTKTCP